MSKDKFKKHAVLPKETPAFFCANCGAVSLDSHGICKVQGKGTKADWCGMKFLAAPQFCHNKVHTIRYQCENCGQVSVNPELLCEPQKMKESE